MGREEEAFCGPVSGGVLQGEDECLSPRGVRLRVKGSDLEGDVGVVVDY